MAPVNATFGAACRALFPLEDGTAYLDHGGFGLAPREVTAARARLAAEVEAAPAPFFAFECRARWAEARDCAARRLGVDPADLALVDNATDGINAVLRAVPLGPGDEVLVTSLAYGAVAMAARHAAESRGATVVRAALRFPDPSPGQCVDAVRAALSPRTRLAVLDHVTSSTALVLPLAEMAAACRARGVPVLADGAHAPGHVEADIAASGADWYVANLHKWCFVPRSCGVLWAAPERQAGLLPNAPSWDMEAGFPACFAWVGTRDPTAWMAVPNGFAFMDRFGEARARARNRTLLREAAAMLGEAWGVRAPAPDEMTGCMTLVPLPDGLPFQPDDAGRLALQQALWLRHRVVASASFAEPSGRMWLRVSAQVYNDMADYEALSRAVLALRAAGRAALSPPRPRS